MLCVFYIIYKFLKEGQKNITILAFVFLFLGTLVSAIQTIPSFDFISHSEVYSLGRSMNDHSFVKNEILEFGKSVSIFIHRVYYRFILLIFPNLFGNSMDRNYSYPENSIFNNYFETSSSIGLIGLLFAMLAIFVCKFKKIYFWIFISFFSFCLFANLPFVNIISALPIINRINLGRLTGIFVFSTCVLSAYGFQYFISKIKNKTFSSTIFVVLISGVFFGQYFMFSSLNKPNNNKQFEYYKNDAVNFLRLNNDYRFVGVGEEGLFGKTPIIPNLSSAYGIRDIRGYFVMTPPRFLGFANDYLNRKRNHFLLDEVINENFLNMYAVKYLVCEKSICEQRLSKYKVEKDFNFFKILVNDSALPMSYVAFNYSYYRDVSDIKRLFNDKNFDISKNILVQGSELKINNNDIPIQQVDFKYNNDKYVFDFNIERSGVLVLSDNNYPGWRAYVNGEEKEVVSVFESIKGVYVNTGDNHIVFEYRPRYFNLGFIISIISTILVILLFLTLIKKRDKLGL